MTEKLADIVLWIGCHGKKIGWLILLSPILWDFACYASRASEEVSVKIGGCFIIIFGAIIIGVASGVDYSTRR